MVLTFKIRIEKGVGRTLAANVQRLNRIIGYIHVLSYHIIGVHLRKA